MAVAAVVRWPLKRDSNKSKCVDHPPGRAKTGRNREVVVVETWIGSAVLFNDL